MVFINQKNNVTCDERHSISILAAFSVDPHASTRSISTQTNISHTSVHRVLKTNLYHPYKIHYVQGLKPSDPERRLEFIANMVVLYENNPNIISNILWTDES